MLKGFWAWLAYILVGQAQGKHARPEERGERYQREIWDDDDYDLPEDYDEWSLEDEDDPDAMRRTGGNPNYDPYFHDSQEFPIVCANGCPEGHLGRHKFSCSRAGRERETSTEMYDLGDSYVREWFRAAMESLKPTRLNLGVAA